MAKQGFKILDSDMHVMEPPDLWERYIDSKYRSQAPRGVTSSNVRDLRMVYPDGRDWARKTVRQPRPDPGHNFERNQEVYRSYAERGWTAEVQIEAMDIEGIDVAVLYPTRGLRALVVDDMEPGFAAALARAYNDWLYDFCEQDPHRLIGAGMISPGTGKHQIGERLEPNLMLRRIYAQPMEQMMALGSFCAGGVLARHPKLRIAFLEANCSWLPWLLWRLDEGWEREGDVWAPDLTLAPSEYFKRHCVVSVEPDEITVKHVIDTIGSNNIVFSTDYPHGDSKYPEAVDRFLKLPLPNEAKRNILWDNCAAFYAMQER